VSDSKGSVQLDDLTICIDKRGSLEFSKVSYPIRYGRFAEIITSDYVYQFNLNGEIKYVRGRNHDWPHPSEWLKRTVANDWVYYSTGGYSGVYDLLGEYYLPFPSYPSNTIALYNPFEEAVVMQACVSWRELIIKIRGLSVEGVDPGIRRFLRRVAEHDEASLEDRSQGLHESIGDRLPVLPPDTRHVDYEVIPIVVADGCRHNCSFCRVKSGRDFRPRAPENILGQIERLKAFYAGDLTNYNALFFGQHDALGAGFELIDFAARRAYETLELDRSYLKGARLFLFSSAESLIQSKESFFESLNCLPFSTYINVGLESVDPDTLAILGKPISVDYVTEAFARMLALNKKYEKIEVTANFVLGDTLPPGHVPALIELIRYSLNHYYGKGAIYLSPLSHEGVHDHGERRMLMKRFNEIKSLSRLPTFLYLIQRL